MTDAEPSNPIEVTTNGTHRVPDVEPPDSIDESREVLNGASVDERLDALLQTIRTWDWRTSPVAAGPRAPEAAAPTSTAPVAARSPAREVAVSTPMAPVAAVSPSVAASTVSPPTTPAAAPAREEPEPPTRPSPVQSIGDTQPVLVGQPRHAKFEPTPEDPEDTPDLTTSFFDPSTRARARSSPRSLAVTPPVQ